MNPAPASRPEFHAATAELNDFVNGWAPKHGVTQVEFLYMAVGMAAQQARVMFEGEQAALRPAPAPAAEAPPG